MLTNIRIVLVEPTHPGNIGAVARAMKNMHLSDLALVAPHRFPAEEATARASGADDVLAGARVTATLDEAIADCTLVIGASARRRSVNWPEFEPRECAQTAWRFAQQGRVALLFGREHSGLTNGELGRCRYLVHIPANPAFSSLNLAMSVQILAYELMLSARTVPPDPVADHQPADAARMQGLIEHLAQAIGDLGFTDPRKSDKLMQRLRRLFQRAEPDNEDINILRGILSAAQGRKSMRRPSS